jgi:hypothetical protein
MLQTTAATTIWSNAKQHGVVTSATTKNKAQYIQHDNNINTKYYFNYISHFLILEIDIVILFLESVNLYKKNGTHPVFINILFWPGKHYKSQLHQGTLEESCIVCWIVPRPPHTGLVCIIVAL